MQNRTQPEKGAAVPGADNREDSPLDRLAAGDPSEEAFEASVPELARLIRGYLSWCRVGHDRLEDLAQEAIIRVYARRMHRTGKDVASLRAWLRAICRNLALSDRAKPQAPTPGVTEDLPVDRWDLREALDHCMSQLKEPEQSVFRLRHVEEMPTREIAELYGWKMRNCEYVLARARKALEKALRLQGYDLR